MCRVFLVLCSAVLGSSFNVYFMMKLELVVRKDVSHVELMTDDRIPLGLIIRDGMKNEAGPVIKHVKSKSMAERSYVVAEGDIILSCNGRNMVGTRAADLQRMIKEAGPKIDLKVEYFVKEAYSLLPGVYRKERMTTKLVRKNNGFGFVLRKRESRHPFSVEFPVISNIKRGGPAYMDNRMQEGDRLLRIDEVNLSCMSLEGISLILQEKDEADFTFEYNISVVDVPVRPENRKIDLEIYLPITDLGIGICSLSTFIGELCIGSIRAGSVAERCGVFSEGDYILSVNEYPSFLLNASKANSLLRSTRRIRKLSFYSKAMELKSLFQVANIPHSVGVQATDYKHFNTPASTNTTLSDRHKSHPGLCYREQVKTIKKFQNIIKHTMGMKQNLSLLTCKAFEDRNIHMSYNNCTACNITEHSVKLCTSCVARINVNCAESMDFMKKIIALFVTASIKLGNVLLPEDVEGKIEPNAIDENCLESVNSKNMIHSLKETLPKVFIGKPKLQKSFRALAEKIANADTCSICKLGINTTSLTVQKLLLLISLNDPSPEIKVLINELVYCLLKTKATCGGDSDIQNSPLDDENCGSESENFHHTSILPSAEGASLDDDANLQHNIVEPAACDMKVKSQSSACGLDVPHLNVNLNKESPVLQLTNMLSPLEPENCHSLNEFDIKQEVSFNKSNNTHFVENYAATAETNLLEDSSLSNNSERFVENTDKKILKDKGLRRAPAKVWKSLDSLLKRKRSSRKKSKTRDDSEQNLNSVQTLVKEMNHVSTSGCSYTNPFQNVSSLLRSKKHEKSNKRNDSTRSSLKCSTSNKNHPVDSVKVRADTVAVKITKDGKGFGFELGYSPSNTPPVPIITCVKPKSPAKRVGILQEKDRVLAINNRKIVGIALTELENLKREVFTSDHITLTVEFDVVEAEVKFGTFEVELEKNLKAGLVYQAFQGDLPVVVSGVVKGSAAHRSGQLFPGDILTFMKCVRYEDFDLVSCNYRRKECVRLTVQRNPVEGIEKSLIQPFTSQENPIFYIPRTDLVDKKNFLLNRTSVRSLETGHILILDQEVTLFRDHNRRNDFGIRLGEHPDSGHIYITDVRPDSPAGASGVIKVYDRIVEVNGKVVGKNEGYCILPLLLKSVVKVDLLIRRLYREGELNNTKVKPFFH